MHDQESHQSRGLDLRVGLAVDASHPSCFLRILTVVHRCPQPRQRLHRQKGWSVQPDELVVHAQPPAGLWLEPPQPRLISQRLLPVEKFFPGRVPGRSLAVQLPVALLGGSVAKLDFVTLTLLVLALPVRMERYNALADPDHGMTMILQTLPSRSRPQTGHFPP